MAPIAVGDVIPDSKSMGGFIRHIHKSLFPKGSSFVCKSPIYFSLSHHHHHHNFSTSSSMAQPVNLQGYNFSPQVNSQITSVLARSKNQSKFDSVLSFFKETGFSNTQLVKIVKYKPGLLLANVDKTIKPKFNILHDLGLSTSECVEIISSNPAILHRSIETRITPSLSVLKGLFESNASIAKLLKRSSWFLVADLNKTMVPNVEFLKSCGVPMNQITQNIYNCPTFILQKPDVVRKAVDKVDELGVHRSSNHYIVAGGVICSVRWELKWKAFRDSGFSEDEILGMFRRAPRVFGFSTEKLKNVLGLLLATGKYTTLCIAKCPNSLGYSIKMRYEPRIRVLESLEKKKVIDTWPSLGTICVTSDEDFFGKFSDLHLNEISETRVGRANLKS